MLLMHVFLYIYNIIYMGLIIRDLAVNGNVILLIYLFNILIRNREVVVDCQLTLVEISGCFNISAQHSNCDNFLIICK